LDKQSERSYS